MSLAALIVDDQEDMRLLLRLAVSVDGRIDIIGESSNGQRALEDILKHRPDLVVLDQMMPGMSGLEVVRRLREKLSEMPKIVLCSAHLNPAMILEAMDAGVDTCLAKEDLMSIPDVACRLCA